MRRGRRHHHRRARRGSGEDQPDVRAVQPRGARGVPRGEARLRSAGPAQSRQGGADARALCRVPVAAGARRQAPASAAAQVLMDTALAGRAARIREASERGTALRLRGGGSKDFYGGTPRGELLDTRAYAGIVAHEPTELVVTARCGTPLSELESALAANGQMLAFEPPHFGPGATVGGCVAAGLSGPRRAAAGALRDYVLGAKLVDGRGRVLRFGGTVMKNVAGYDVSRLLAGALGTLGLIAEISLKLFPRPGAELTLRLEMPEERALESLNRWAGQPLPISASAWNDGDLGVRLSGADSALPPPAERIGREPLEGGGAEG